MGAFQPEHFKSVDELLKALTWVQALNFPDWDVEEDEQTRWVAKRKVAGFDLHRTRVLAAVQIQEANAPLSEAEHQVLRSIYATGLATANEWSFVEGLSDCAAADFDLIARALRVGYSDFWLDRLRAEYEAGRFPHSPL